MTDYKAPIDDLKFLMFDVFNVEALWQSLPALADIDRATAEAIIEEAAKISEQVIGPLNREADEQGCQWVDGEVTAPDGFKEAYQTFAEGGWVGLGGNSDYDGMGMPKSLVSAVEEMVQGACMSFGLAPMLTAGACLAIDAHADEVIKARYLPKMYSGAWSGAMDLTEPHCGTDLGLIRTKATPNGDGSYALSGTKIFITWGEHDMSENIVHLVLAKLPDAPKGSKGISLFLVPKFIPQEDGSCGERNRFSCGSIEKKMGIKGSATCVMNFDGARGWLIGGEHQGLACMFTMMNYERLVVGIQAIGAAQLSYQRAAEYALDRLQSRSPTGPMQPEKEADPLVVHADVRRMLMNMKAYNEASRAFYIYCAKWLDLAKYSEDAAQQKTAGGMVALLTPIAKAFISDVAFRCAVDGQQVFGGHGYIREWGQEQLVRDIRITQIYEGTNGIQAMDLTGRKTVMAKGALWQSLKTEMLDFAEASEAGLRTANLLDAFQQAVQCADSTTKYVVEAAAKDPHAIGAAAVNYQELLGHVLYAYMWCLMVVEAQSKMNVQAQKAFMESKLHTAHYYFEQLLPVISSLEQKIRAGSTSMMSLSEHQW